MNSFKSSAICLAILGCNTALADNHLNIENTLVTATRTEQGYASTLASVTIFDRNDLEKYQTQSLPEILSRAAGISVTRNGGRGSSSSISLRGNQSDHTLFLINGVRVGSVTLGQTPIELIDPDQIERIEIVRGPKSSLYGSDALGGVINIITRTADSSQPLTVTGSIGNNATRESTITAGYSQEQFSTSLNLSTVRSDDIDSTEDTSSTHGDDDGIEQDSLGLNINYTPIKSLVLGFNYQYSDSETEYDTSCADSTTFDPLICSPYSETIVEVGQLSAGWQITSVWKSRLRLGLSKNESEEFAREIDINETFSGGIFNTERTDISWQNDLRLSEQLLLTAGYDYLHEEVSGSIPYNEKERDNDAVFLQLQWAAGRLSANLGVRNDDNEQFGNADTFNATIGYELSTELKVIASYGEAFKAPTFNDLYYPDFGNDSLIPEESDTYEIALQSLRDNMEWSVRAYRNNVDNLIQYNSTLRANDQITSATIEGLELSLATQLMGWDISSAISLLDTEDNRTGNELARRPKQIFNLDIDRQFGRWSIGTTFYASSNRFNDAANNVELSGYGTVAVRTAYKANDEWTFRLKADNLFEKEYYLASSFSSGLYNQPGLEVLLSVVYTPRF